MFTEYPYKAVSSDGTQETYELTFVILLMSCLINNKVEFTSLVGAIYAWDVRSKVSLRPSFE